MFKDFLIAWVLTNLSESMAILALARFLFGYPQKKLSNTKLILTCVAASTLTLPMLWFIVPLVIHNYGWYIILGESLVIAIEAMIYYLVLRKDFITSLLISLVCNLFSILIGSLIL